MQVKLDLVMVCEFGAVLVAMIAAWLVGLTFVQIVDVVIIAAMVMVLNNVVMCVAAMTGVEWAMYPEKKLVISREKVGIE